MFENQFFWKLWDAANVITGFAAVQALTFAFIFIPKEKKVVLSSAGPALGSMFVFLLAGCLVYCLGVYFTIRWAKSLLNNSEKLEITEENRRAINKKLSLSALGRIFAIIFFTSIDLCILSMVG